MNNTIIGELLKDVKDEDFSKLHATTLDDVIETPKHDETISPADSLNSSLNKIKKVHIAPDVSNIITMLDDDTILLNLSQNHELPEDIHLELENCLERLKSEASEILLITTNFKRQEKLSDQLIATQADGNMDLLKEKLLSEVESKKLLIEQINQNKKLTDALQNDRDKLENQLIDLMKQHEILQNELVNAKRKMEEFLLQQKEIICEGYGENEPTNLVQLGKSYKVTTIPLL